jgi:hypothetical protein
MGIKVQQKLQIIILYGVFGDWEIYLFFATFAT